MASINIAVTGSVDSAKSSTVAVLTQYILDNGNGGARSKIVTLKHEIESGRTSAVNLVTVRNPKVTPPPASTSPPTPTESSPPKTAHAETLRFLDLAGHEKYLRTTLRGLTNYFPDYALLVISSLRGVLPITREHFNICRSLGIPVIIVVTKIDICPPEILAQTMDSIKMLCKIMAIKFLMEFSTTDAEGTRKVFDAFCLNPTTVVPLIQVSNVSGQGIDQLRSCLFDLPAGTSTTAKKNLAITKFVGSIGMKKLFFVFTPYSVRGVGMVLHGSNRLAPIAVNDRLMVGPVNNSYIEVRVRSVHNDATQFIDRLEPGRTGCLAIRAVDPKVELTKSMFSHGRIATDVPVLIRRIKAEIMIMTHSTTIQLGYCPFIHCAGVGVSAKIIDGDTFPLRSRQRSSVTFEFLTPQFVYPEAKLLFRDGNIKGIGIVREVYQ
jgi:elongation factor 1-alpha